MDQRDEATYRDFVRARWSPLRRMAFLLTADEGRAEDLLQEALVKLWFVWHRVHDGNPEAYVRRILVNTAISGRRRRWRGELPTAELPELTGGDIVSQVDDRDALRRAMGELSDRQRAVVVLRYVEDLSEREVAELLGCSVGTVKGHASRGLARLRQLPGLCEAASAEPMPVAHQTTGDQTGRTR